MAITYIHDNSQFIIGNEYYFVSNNYVSSDLVDLTFGNNSRVYYSVLEVFVNTTSSNVSNSVSLRVWKSSSRDSYDIYLYDANGDTVLSGVSSSSYIVSFKFIFNGSNMSETFLSNTDCFYYETEDVGLIGSYAPLITDYLGIPLGVIVGILSLFCLFKIAFKRG